MTETTGAVHNGFVLRMSVPATGEISALGPELGAKLAEQLGLAPPVAATVGAAVTGLADGFDTASDISFEFHKEGVELHIDARQGETSRRATVPLKA